MIIRKVVEHFIFVYTSLKKSVLHLSIPKKSQVPFKSEIKKQDEQQAVVAPPVNVRARFCNLEKPKQKPCPMLLVLAVYLAPLILVFQLVGVFSLLIFGNYTPGFIFLISSLALLGFISMKIMIHDKGTIKKKSEIRRIKGKQE